MSTDYTELREAIAQSRIGQTRWQCPAQLREKVVEFTKERRREGVAMLRVAKELGMSESGLSRWLRPKAHLRDRAQSGDRQLRPVRVAEMPSSRDSLVLITPGGYRLEGLSSSSAADVLQRLGC